MAYVEQTWVTGEDDTAAKNNQVRDNIKDHQHGVGGVTGTMGPISVTTLTASGRGSILISSDSAQLKLGRTTTSAGEMWLGADVDGLRIFDAAFATVLSWNHSGKQLAGTVPLPRLTAADGGGYPQSGTGGETLRTIRGTVSSAGSIVYGGGFSITKGVAGVYSITASSAFSAIPTIIITVHDGGGFVNQISLRSTTGAQIVLTDIAGSFADRAFDFVMIGPP